MKVFTNNAVYVQKNDIAYLTDFEESIPASIFLKVFGSGVVIVNDDNRYEFVRFDEEREIEYFKNIEWIIDYQAIKNLTEEEIVQIGRSISEERNEIAKTFNAMSEEEQNNNVDMMQQCEILYFKMYSLRDFLWFKQGYIQMELPDDEEYPELSQKTEKNGLRRLLSKFKSKNNNQL